MNAKSSLTRMVSFAFTLLSDRIASASVEAARQAADGNESGGLGRRRRRLSTLNETFGFVVRRVFGLTG